MALFADYLTISGMSESESRVKGSRFIGIALPCVTESDIQSNLSEVSRRYPNATHYCYAAVYGGTLRTEKSSDNGEPSGTAAKPILSVIKGRDLTDTMVVVVSVSRPIIRRQITKKSFPSGDQSSILELYAIASICACSDI